uniref:CCHC-type domain-containing protein n=1 Tax=Skeletonema marinoi TaxID=267567 RepID=A0A7S2PQC8_9STRA|mmetsp:Transcript_27215/g.46080  ORF Transcript_27215/g.46080 Transcript_27215/m.46080 type:complete len:304 (+) Transcript_27215:449-1360(+)
MSAQKAVKVIIFSGDKEHFPSWRLQFKAVAHLRGYNDILSGTRAVPTTSELANAPTAEVVQAGKDATAAYCDLLLSFPTTTKKGEVAFRIVVGAVNADHPEGNAKIAWDRLTEKYSPTNARSLIDLKSKWDKCYLDNRDPEEWITELCYIQTEMGKISITGATRVSDTDLILHILSRLPASYDTVTPLLHKDLDAGTLTIEGVRITLCERFKRIEDLEDSKVYSGTEQEEALVTLLKNATVEELKAALSASSGDAFKFKGTCYHCGKRGHRASDCNEKKNDTDDTVDDTENENSDEEVNYWLD